MMNAKRGWFLPVLLLAGCLSSGQKTVTAPPVSPVPSQPLAPGLSGTASKAIRSLPSRYLPGQPVKVKIAVFPNPVTAAIIVQETVPVGWKIVTSSPPSQKKEGRNYKWLFWGKELKPFEIIYEVLPEETAAGQAVFDGVIKTHEEKSVPISGDSVLKIEDGQQGRFP